MDAIDDGICDWSVFHFIEVHAHCETLAHEGMERATDTPADVHVLNHV